MFHGYLASTLSFVSASRRDEIFIAPRRLQRYSSRRGDMSLLTELRVLSKMVVYKYLAPTEPKRNWLNQAPAIIMRVFQNEVAQLVKLRRRKLTTCATSLQLSRGIFQIG